MTEFVEVRKGRGESALKSPRKLWIGIFSLFIESPSLGLDKVFRSVVRLFDIISRFTTPVTSHRIPRASPETHGPYGLINIVSVLFSLMDVVGISVRIRLFFIVVSRRFGPIVVTMVLLGGAQCERCMQSVFFSRFFKVPKMSSFRLVTF